ncbi:MAG: type pilus modification protein PilV [Pseudomonadota bacterium]
MLEVMVTLLIISFCLIAVVGMQLSAKRAGHLTRQRSLAMNLAQEMVERIRINPGQAAAYHTGIGASALGGATISTTPVNCADNACTPAQLVSWDRWQWERRLDGVTVTNAQGTSLGGLIEPKGCIVFTATDAALPNSGQVRVIVNWRGLNASTDAVQSGEALCGSISAGQDATRRQVVLNTYVFDPGELDP